MNDLDDLKQKEVMAKKIFIWNVPATILIAASGYYYLTIYAPKSREILPWYAMHLTMVPLLVQPAVFGTFWFAARSRRLKSERVKTLAGTAHQEGYSRPLTVEELKAQQAHTRNLTNSYLVFSILFAIAACIAVFVKGVLWGIPGFAIAFLMASARKRLILEGSRMDLFKEFDRGRGNIR